MKKIKQFLRDIFAPRVYKSTYYYGTNHGQEVHLNKMWKKMDEVWKEMDNIFKEVKK